MVMAVRIDPTPPERHLSKICVIFEFSKNRKFCLKKLIKFKFENNFTLTTTPTSANNILSLVANGHFLGPKNKHKTQQRRATARHHHTSTARANQPVPYNQRAEQTRLKITRHERRATTRHNNRRSTARANQPAPYNPRTEPARKYEAAASIINRKNRKYRGRATARHLRNAIVLSISHVKKPTPYNLPRAHQAFRKIQQITTNWMQASRIQQYRRARNIRIARRKLKFNRKSQAPSKRGPSDLFEATRVQSPLHTTSPRAYPQGPPGKQKSQTRKYNKISPQAQSTGPSEPRKNINCIRESRSPELTRQVTAVSRQTTGNYQKYSNIIKIDLAAQRVTHPGRIYVIGIENSIIYSLSESLANTILSTDSNDWGTTLSTNATLQKIISETVLNAEMKKSIVTKFITHPPSFVSHDNSEEFTIDAQSYSTFLYRFIGCCESSASAITELDHKNKTKNLADSFSTLENVIKRIKTYFPRKCLDLNGCEKSFKTVFKSQLRIFISTLVGLVLFDDLDVKFDWPARPIRKPDSLLDIKSKGNTTAHDLITLIEYRSSARADFRAKVETTLYEKMDQLFGTEIAALTGNDKVMYETYVRDSVKNWLVRYYKRKLNASCTAGVAATISLLKQAYSTSEFLTVLSFIEKDAAKIGPIIDLTDIVPPTKADVSVDVSKVTPTYVPSVLEAPSLGSKIPKDFSPPKFRSTGDFLVFIENVANVYFSLKGLDYNARAAAIWYTLPTCTLKNSFSRKFKPFIDANLINSNEDYVNFYLRVCKELFPLQIKSAIDYEQELNDPRFQLQKPFESIEDYLSRLVDRFKLAYPDCFDDASKRLRICRIFYQGLRNTQLQAILRKDHYDLLFVEGRYNDALKILLKKERENEALRRLSKMSIGTHREEINYISGRNKKVTRKFQKHDHKPNHSKYNEKLNKEISFLRKRKNVGLDGKLIIPISQIPHFIKSKPDFDARDYIRDAKTFRAIREMAKKNLETADSKRKRTSELAVKRRRYKRSVENKFRRNNVAVLASRDTVSAEVNTISGHVPNSFLVTASIDSAPISLLIDTGANRTVISNTLVKQLGLTGKIRPYRGPRLEGVSSTSLHSTGLLTVDIVLSADTIITDVPCIVIENLKQPCILGSDVFTQVARQLGFYIGSSWHQNNCKNAGKAIGQHCKTLCRDLHDQFVLCPNTAHPDFITMVDEQVDAVRSNTINNIVFGVRDSILSYTENPDDTVKRKLIANEYSIIEPHSCKPVKVRLVQLSDDGVKWSDSTVDSISIAEPIGRTNSLCHMTDEDSKILNSTIDTFPVVNRSARRVHLHPNSDICSIKLLNPGQRLREIDDHILKDYQTEKIDEKVGKYPGGISFPLKSNHKLMYDGSYKKLTHEYLGEEIPECDKEGPTPPSDKQVTFFHIDEKGTRHKISVECHLSGALKRKFKKALTRFSKVFFTDPTFFPFLRHPVTQKPFYAELGLKPDAVLRAYPPIKLSRPHAAALNDLIKHKIANGTFVELENQPWSGQLMVVQKPRLSADGNAQYRLVQSVIGLNNNCSFKQYKLPLPREVINKVVHSDSKYFNSFDAKSSYDSVRLKRSDVKYTSCRIPKPDGNGHITVANDRLPQGALNSASSVCTIYDNIFSDLYTECNFANYLDDFLQSGSDLTVMVDKTIKILERCFLSNVLLSPEKCRFFVEQVVFCNIAIKQNRHCIPQKYASKIIDFREPTSTLELQTFLGLCCFAKAYIKGYGSNAAKLADVLYSEKTKEGWGWNNEHSEAFKSLKKGVLNPHSLHTLDPRKSEIHVYTDSSHNCYGIVLVQHLPEDTTNPYRLLDIVSKSIHRTNRNVSILRKELNALILSMSYFDRIFSNPDFKVIFYIDSQVLFSLTKQTGRSPKLHLFLTNVMSIYRPCEIRWCPSAKNPADSPSRLVESLDSQKNDQKVLKIMNFNFTRAELGASVEGTSILEKFTDATSTSQVKAITTRKMTRLLADQNNEDSSNRSTTNTLDSAQCRDDYDIHRPVGESNDRSRSRLYSEVLKSCQEPAKTAYEKSKRAHGRWHLSAKKLSELYGLPRSAAEAIVGECPTCSALPGANRHPQIKERRHDTHCGPNICISSDIAHMTETGRGYKYLLVTHCAFSRFTRVAPLRRLDSDSIYSSLCNLFAGSGFPCIFRTDGAAYYHSARMKGLLCQHNCLLESISPGRSNAQRVERIIREIRDFFTRRNTTWSDPDSLYELCMYLNVTQNHVNSKTYGSITPFELFFGRLPNPDNLLQLVRPQIKPGPCTQSEVNFKTLTNEIRPVQPTLVQNPFKVGERLFYRRGGRKDGKLLPGVIHSVDDESVTLKTQDNILVTRHLTDVCRPYVT